MDIPGAFLHADMEEIVHMVLEGEISELIVKLELETYDKYVWYNWKESQCYMYNSRKHYMGLYRQHYYFGTIIQYMPGVGFQD